MRTFAAMMTLTLAVTAGLVGINAYAAAPASAAAYYNCSASWWGAGTFPARNGGRVYAPQWVNQTTGGNATNRCYMWAGDASTNVGANGSAQVEVLQAALNRCYGQNLDVDGKFGWRTEQALKVAQRIEDNRVKRDIAVDGKYGPETRQVLRFSKKAPSNSSGGGCGRIKRSHLD